MMWNEKIETMTRQDLEELQLKKLQNTVKYAFDKIPYYNKKYSEAEVFPEDIETLKDIEKLPFITKDDLRESYPFGLFAVEMSKIKELHSSSGTTGKSKAVMLSLKNVFAGFNSLYRRCQFNHQDSTYLFFFNSTTHHIISIFYLLSILAITYSQ